MIKCRIIIFLTALISIIFLPWWVGTFIAIIGLSLFSFEEIFFLAFTLDMLYGLKEPLYMRFIFLFSSFILYIFVTNLKKIIRTK